VEKDKVDEKEKNIASLKCETMSKRNVSLSALCAILNFFMLTTSYDFHQQCFDVTGSLIVETDYKEEKK
jgi:hypothetical protein